MYQPVRPRRRRQNEAIRAMVRENELAVSDLICPLFVVEGQNVKEEISSMPDYFRFSLDTLETELEEISTLGIKAVLLFVKVPDDLKDNAGTEALNDSGLMQRAIRFIKEKQPSLYLMTDVALDPYSSFGHDGIVKEGQIVNDMTVDILAEMAVCHAKAGADMVAPSDMMDGRIGAIRYALDDAGLINCGIMSYTAKYASSFYGPFRDALDSAPGFGDKKTYQMDPANSLEALIEADLDTQEGADILMVKPGLPYLDMVRMLKEHSRLTIAVYNVSGEYAMIKAAALKGWLNEQDVMMECMTSFKRAGANLIVTYFAKDIARLLKKN